MKAARRAESDLWRSFRVLREDGLSNIAAMDEVGHLLLLRLAKATRLGHVRQGGVTSVKVVFELASSGKTPLAS